MRIGSLAILCGVILFVGGCLFGLLDNVYFNHNFASVYVIPLGWMLYTPLLGTILVLVGILLIAKAVRTAE